MIKITYGNYIYTNTSSIRYTVSCIASYLIPYRRKSTFLNFKANTLSMKIQS